MRVIQGNGFRIFVGQPEGGDVDPAEVAQQLLDVLGRDVATAVCWQLLGKLGDLDDDDQPATALGQLLEGERRTPTNPYPPPPPSQAERLLSLLVPDSKAPPPGDCCSPWEADWCPVHGECTCPSFEGDELSASCALHGMSSSHGEGGEP